MIELVMEFDPLGVQSKQAILDYTTWENVELCMQEAAREKDETSKSAEDDS